MTTQVRARTPMSGGNVVHLAAEAILRFLQQSRDPVEIAEVLNATSSPDIPEQAIVLALRQLLELGRVTRNQSRVTISRT